jgi:large conductance mechanosensitive channel
MEMTREDEILDELKKIRQLLEPKSTAPPPAPGGIWQEFIDFIGKAGVLGLAVGFIMGTYIGKVVQALVNDIIMPVPGALISGGDWRNAILTIPVGNGISLAIGDFVGVVVDFVIVASVVFIMVKYAKRAGIK